MKNPKKNKKSYKLSPQKDFERFRKFFPFSCVDLILTHNNGILLSKRTIPPYIGKWHLPGGIIHKNEKMEQVVKRIAKTELNLNIKISGYLGTYENPSKFRHDISHCFLCKKLSGKLKTNSQNSHLKFFKNIPKNTIPYHKKMLDDAKIRLKIK